MTGDRLSDDEEAEMLERISTAATAEAFREFVCDQLPIEPGDSVLSVGCGPGFETAALARRVGEEGRVTGVDVNEAVLSAAADRCGDLPQVSFERGDVTDLPVPTGSYDLAVAKQVLQFVSEVESALAELFRVLEPGGRAAVVTGVEGSHAMHTPTELTRRAEAVYDDATGGRNLGTRLVSLLPEAGFAVEDVVPRARVQTEINDQVDRGIDVRREFLETSDAFDDSEIEAWERDLRALDEAGQFLSCATSLVYVGRKPA